MWVGLGSSVNHHWSSAKQKMNPVGNISEHPFLKLFPLVHYHIEIGLNALMSLFQDTGMAWGFDLPLTLEYIICTTHPKKKTDWKFVHAAARLIILWL
jgi:hypothetical protein